MILEKTPRGWLCDSIPETLELRNVIASLPEFVRESMHRLPMGTMIAFHDPDNWRICRSHDQALWWDSALGVE